MTIVLTHARGRFEGLMKRLACYGYQVTHQPLLSTQPLCDAATKANAQALLDCDWLFFSSRSAVEAWQALGLCLTNSQPQLAAVGRKTAAALEAAGGTVHLIAQPENAEGLAHSFLTAGHQGSVGLPQGNLALATLQLQLEEQHVAVHPVTIYQTVHHTWQVTPADLIVVTSPSAIRALPKEQTGLLITLGPSSSQVAKEQGWNYQQADDPSITAIIRVIKEVHHDHTAA